MKKVYLLLMFLGVLLFSLVGVSALDVNYLNISDDFHIYNNDSIFFSHRGLNISSVDFNGINSYGNLSLMNHMINISNNFTIDMVVYLKDINTNQALFEHVINGNNRFGLTISGGGIRGAFYNGSHFFYNASSQTFYNPANKLVMISYTFNGTGGILYINRFRLTGPSTPSLTSNTGAGIGKATSSALYFNGSILELSIYNDSIWDAGGMEHYNRNELFGNEGREGIPFLLYHKFSNDYDYLNANSDVAINTTNFDIQMKFLSDNGYHNINLNEFYNWTKGLYTLPERPFIIYIDDADITTYTEALPVLDKYNFTAVVAVITNFINSSGYLNSSQIINLSRDYNWEIASHSVNHTRMTSLTIDEAIYEFNQSKESLKDILGYYPQSFVYPYNDKNVSLNNICGQYYEICGANGSDSSYPEYNRINANLTSQGLERISLGFLNSKYIHIYNVMQIYPKPYISWRLWNESNIINNNVTNSLNTGSYNISLFNTVITNHFYDNLTILNLNNAMVLYRNNSLKENNLFTGNYSLYFNNSEIGFLNNYNITEGVSRPYDPIWFSSSSSTSKHIASNLSNSITVDIFFNVDSCENIGNIYYTPNGGNKLLYQRGSYSCNNNVVTLSSMTINPSTESNEIEIEYGCSTFTTTGFSIIMLFAGLIIIVFLGLYIKNKGMELNVMDIVIMFVLLMVVIALWQISGQNLGSACPVS